MFAMHTVLSDRSSTSKTVPASTKTRSKFSSAMLVCQLPPQACCLDLSFHNTLSSQTLPYAAPRPLTMATSPLRPNTSKPDGTTPALDVCDKQAAKHTNHCCHTWSASLRNPLRCTSFLLTFAVGCTRRTDALRTQAFDPLQPSARTVNLCTSRQAHALSSNCEGMELHRCS